MRSHVATVILGLVAVFCLVTLLMRDVILSILTGVILLGIAGIVYGNYKLFMENQEKEEK